MAAYSPLLSHMTHRTLPTPWIPVKHSSSSGVAPSTRHCRHTHVLRRALTLRTPDDNAKEFYQDTISIGSSSTADFRINGPNVASEHAQLAQRSGRTFCTALVGEEDDLTSSTYTWLNGDQIRKGVAYVVAPETELAFGEHGNVCVVDFTESSGNSAIFETLLKGMAAGASDDVKKQVLDSLDK